MLKQIVLIFMRLFALKTKSRVEVKMKFEFINLLTSILFIWLGFKLLNTLNELCNYLYLGLLAFVMNCINGPIECSG